MVLECKRCFYNENHPLGLVIDDEGICSGCRVHEEKDHLDWNHRFEELKKIVSRYKTDKAKYDCIIPVSGGKDSFFIVDVVKNRLGMKPLLVSYNKLFNSSVGIENLANLRVQFDCDFIQKNINPEIAKKITRRTLYKYGNPYWHCIAGETVFPVQIAVQLKIPLIIWGAHQGLEQVGMYSHLDNVEMTRRYRHDHDLFGIEPKDISDTYDDLEDNDLINFLYPPFTDIESVGVRGIYLGNYIRWDPYAQHLKMVKKFKFKGMRLSRTFDCYDYSDSLLYSDLHDVLKYYKHGYSKVTDHVSREIRFKRITKEFGRKIINYFSSQNPTYVEIFCRWLGVDEKSLQLAMNNYRNPMHWKEIDQNIWIKKASPKRITKVEKVLHYPNLSKSKINENNYITVGKGVDWPKPVLKKKQKWL